MSQFVRIAEDEDEEPIEIPAEEDGTLLLSTLVAQHPGACGLKYRSRDTGGIRGIRLADGVLHPPEGSWGETTFLVVFPKVSKRKGDDDDLDSPASKVKKPDSEMRCSDLIVLGLPWKSTEEDVKNYFSQFGELSLAQVKRNQESNQSRGYGFIRFKDYTAQIRCLTQKHNIDGRWCDVALPNSFKPGGSGSNERKIFVGRCTEDITADNLRDYFCQFGEVTDVFIPKPFRAFAFVTFQDPKVAQSLYGENHLVKGVSLHVGNATPKNKDPNKRANSQSSMSHSQQQQQQVQAGAYNSQSQAGAGGATGYGTDYNVDPSYMNNMVGINLLGTAMMAAAQAVFQGQTLQQGNSNSSSYSQK